MRQTGTAFKRLASYCLYSIWNYNICETNAIYKCHLSNRRHTVRNINFFEATTSRKSRFADAYNIVWNDCVLTSRHKHVCLCIDNRIATISAIILRIFFINDNVD